LPIDCTVEIFQFTQSNSTGSDAQRHLLNPDSVVGELPQALYQKLLLDLNLPNTKRSKNL